MEAPGTGNGCNQLATPERGRGLLVPAASEITATILLSALCCACADPTLEPLRETHVLRRTGVRCMSTNVAETDPAEGSLEVIERELARQEKRQGKAQPSEATLTREDIIA